MDHLSTPSQAIGQLREALATPHHVCICSGRSEFHRSGQEPKKKGE